MYQCFVSAGGNAAGTGSRNMAGIAAAGGYRQEAQASSELRLGGTKCYAEFYSYWRNIFQNILICLPLTPKLKYFAYITLRLKHYNRTHKHNKTKHNSKKKENKLMKRSNINSFDLIWAVRINLNPIDV